MDPTPEQLLGLRVVGPGGSTVGVVVDVGLSNWRQPKFLLVQPSPGATRLVRVDFGDVQEVGAEAVRIAAVPIGARGPSLA